MSAALPTEEDVLAFLVLNMALGELFYAVFGGPERSAIRAAIDDWKVKDRPRALEFVAHERLLEHDGFHVEAIADSERRVAVECAERMALRSLRLWAADGCGPNWAGHLKEDARWLRFVDAERR